MTFSRPLLALLVVTACATAYVAWLDGSTLEETPVPRAARGAVRPAPAPAVTPPDLSVATPHPDLFRRPGWRLGAMQALPEDESPDPLLPPVNDAPPARRPPAISATAIWQDTRGVMVVLEAGGASRIACADCTAPGSLQPGQGWRGYRLDAIEAEGARVTELSTGRRLHLTVVAGG
ncbi:hypothetical protein [Cupriavidus agavae]|uniref:Type II secretion system protein GspC N-terminal domain-containing protein n=1 Tax=Cupriavidus agavae TaxID=1001822 RepID=A0A4Q7RDL2_9BURK|nr:hypothetical protein [Cupriavidus agavae]RZT31261.1 hypothetical protein EV147_4442 [Cupriavidus agavae]